MTSESRFLAGRSLLVGLSLTAFCIPVQAEEFGATTLDTSVYEKLIETIETRGGAYSGELSEPLLGLGLALQSRGRHEEAIALFKRGVHLARINDGLYSAAQIPMLEGEIASHMASGNYASADERQRYLYRVQVRARTSGGKLAEVFMKQADWQFRAYRLGVGDSPDARLVAMQDLYIRALSDVRDTEGERSSNLVPPLEGLLRTQYLIADYKPPQNYSAEADGWAARQNQRQFNLFQSQNYAQGKSVITSLYRLEQEELEDRQASRGTAEAQIMLGDWHLYNGRPDAAQAAYTIALQELATLDDAQQLSSTLLGQPAALPDIDELRPLSLFPQRTEGDILLKFTVSSRGRAQDIERLDDNEAYDSQANRLIRRLRKTKFRPRFEGGQAVETEGLVYAVNMQ